MPGGRDSGIGIGDSQKQRPKPKPKPKPPASALALTNPQSPIPNPGFKTNPQSPIPNPGSRYNGHLLVTKQNMAKASARAPVLGPAFIRLLARFGDADLPSTPPVLTGRLAQWFDWNRALTLSAALDDALPDIEDGPGFDAAEEAACHEARTALVQAIDGEIDLAPPKRPDPAMADIDPGFLPYRRHCLALQRSMAASSGRLRGRLRDMLARQSAQKARLAEVDAVMEAVLSPREQSLLAQVPNLLGLHYQHLRDAAPQETAPPPSPTTTSPTTSASPWLARFRQDLRTALLAELEVRFHPIEGLLAALRTR